MVKNLPAIQDIWVWSLGQEDPLEKGMATHFSTPAWRIPWTEEPGGLSTCGCKEQDTTEKLTHTHLYVYMKMREEKIGRSKNKKRICKDLQELLER